MGSDPYAEIQKNNTAPLTGKTYHPCKRGTIQMQSPKSTTKSTVGTGNYTRTRVGIKPIVGLHLVYEN